MERSRGTTAIIRTQFKNIALRHKVQQWRQMFGKFGKKNEPDQSFEQCVETGEVQAKVA